MIKNVLTFLALLLLVWFSFQREQATPVNTQDTKRFSAVSAVKYLEGFAQKPHPIGSLENKKARDYIVKTLQDLGLEVRVDSGYVTYLWGTSNNRMARVENIIATLKGNEPNGKKVVLAGHYDSVFEGPGAADDGYSIACMIETVKMLKDQPRKNDIELLITDGEEMGLFGAQHYVANNDVDPIGILLNFEARGNEGPGLAFEFSNNNAWLIQEMEKVSNRPIASSLSYEIYKRMPNGSDFTVFAEKGIQGINYAFIDGFSYYHHPQDNIENLSLNSVQHTGENMYLMARHFANYDFDAVPEGNASFFNFYGTLIHYPAQADFFILVFGLLLLAFTYYKTLQHQNVTLKKTAFAFFGILGTLLLVIALNLGFVLLIIKAYPQYGTFYSYHYYNHEWYLLAGLGLAISIVWWLGSRLLARLGKAPMGIGIATILGILSIALYTLVPTGAFQMIYPLIAITIGILLTEILQLKPSHWQYWLLNISMLSVLIGTWTNTFHSVFLGFSLYALPAAVIFPVLFGFSALSLIPSLWNKSEKLVPIVSISLFVFAFVNAHLTSKPTPDAPLKSDLFFVEDRANDQQYWASKDPYINPGHLGKLDQAEEGRIARHLPYTRWKKPTDIKATAYYSTYSMDTLEVSSTVRLNVKNQKRAGKCILVFPEIQNVDKLYVDGQLNYDFSNDQEGYFYTSLFGIGADSLTIEVIKRDMATPIPAHINFDYRESIVSEELPENMVRKGASTYVSDGVTF